MKEVAGDMLRHDKDELPSIDESISESKFSFKDINSPDKEVLINQENINGVGIVETHYFDPVDEQERHKEIIKISKPPERIDKHTCPCDSLSLSISSLPEKFTAIKIQNKELKQLLIAKENEINSLKGEAIHYKAEVERLINPLGGKSLLKDV